MIATLPVFMPRRHRSGQTLAFLAGCVLGAALFWHSALDQRFRPAGSGLGIAAPAPADFVPRPQEPEVVPLEAASVATVVAEAADTAPPLPASVGGEQIGLEIVYDLNSSFLPPAGAQDLERLLARLRPDRRYELELVAAVNEQGVRGANATDARRYNRWLAERRLERLTGWLNREAVLSLEIRGRLVEGDSTRRVAVGVRELP